MITGGGGNSYSRNDPPGPAPACYNESMIFMTGFPGFIGERLAQALQNADPDTRFLFLVQERFRAQAEASLDGLNAALVTGDLTQPGLGLGTGVDRGAIREVWHLAALYDLEARREPARAINIEGTERVLEFCRTLPSLRRLHYVSTCYVSGDATGIFREEDLDRGQGFKNHYEWSKFEAEKRVRAAMEAVPATVYRPSIVVGDSRTGETAKFDGPYHILESMKRLPPWSAFFKIGAGTAEVNLVPVDYLVEAMVSLGRGERGRGRTYQIADPAPLTVFEVERALAGALGRRFLYLPLPLAAANAFLSVPPIRAALAIPKASLPYFVHPVHYDTRGVERDLEGSGLRCPRLTDYLPAMVRFFLEHRRSVRKEAMA